jgi:hypothetical protein
VFDWTSVKVGPFDTVLFIPVDRLHLVPDFGQDGIKRFGLFYFFGTKHFMRVHWG